jgi:beta-carotene 3-hydroxylase
VTRWRSVALAAAGFAAMEPVAAAVHRWVMHGRGWGWHRSHHLETRPGPEANDGYPVAMAAATSAAMAAGRLVPRLRPLLAVGTGITAYGAAYVIVHDLLVHERLGPLPGTGSRYVRWVARAHAGHHEGGGPPYGFLLPVVARPGGADAAVPAQRGAEGLGRPISDRAATRTFVAVGTRARVEKTS